MATGHQAMHGDKRTPTDGLVHAHARYLAVYGLYSALFQALRRERHLLPVHPASAEANPDAVEARFPLAAREEIPASETRAETHVSEAERT